MRCDVQVSSPRPWNFAQQTGGGIGVPNARWCSAATTKQTQQTDTEAQGREREKAAETTYPIKLSSSQKLAAFGGHAKAAAPFPPAASGGQHTADAGTTLAGRTNSPHVRHLLRFRNLLIYSSSIKLKACLFFFCPPSYILLKILP